MVAPPGGGGEGAGSTGGGVVTGDWLPGRVPGAVAGVVAGAPGTVTVVSAVSGLVVRCGAAADGAVVATDSVTFVPPVVVPGERPLRATPMTIRPQTITATAQGAERTHAHKPEAGRTWVWAAAGVRPVSTGPTCGGGSMVGTLSADITCSVHRPPSQYRLKWRPDGSGFQLPSPSGLAAGSGSEPRRFTESMLGTVVAEIT